MTGKEALHQIVDELPDQDVPTARRILEALRFTSDPLVQTLLHAPIDDEPDLDDADGGLTEARREADAGELLSHDDLLKQLGTS